MVREGIEPCSEHSRYWSEGQLLIKTPLRFLPKYPAFHPVQPSEYNLGNFHILFFFHESVGAKTQNPGLTGIFPTQKRRISGRGNYFFHHAQPTLKQAEPRLRPNGVPPFFSAGFWGATYHSWTPELEQNHENNTASLRSSEIPQGICV